MSVPLPPDREIGKAAAFGISSAKLLNALPHPVIAILPVAIVPRHPVYVTLAAALIAVVVAGLLRRR